jgi:hypothetical protein
MRFRNRLIVAALLLIASTSAMAFVVQNQDGSWSECHWYSVGGSQYLHCVPLDYEIIDP